MLFVLFFCVVPLCRCGKPLTIGKKNGSRKRESTKNAGVVAGPGAGSWRCLFLFLKSSSPQVLKAFLRRALAGASG